MHNNKVNNFANFGHDFCQLIEDLLIDVDEIDCQKLSEIKDNKSTSSLAIVDVRESHEVVFGTIPDSILLSKGILEREVAKNIPNKNTIIVLYCAVGARSVISAYMLKKMGYSSVYSLKGGFNEWLRFKSLKG